MIQQFSQLIDDKGAVSPVIGVILMVAITVILAAVIGTFVLGLGGQVSQTAPQASISVQSADIGSSGPDTITLKHGGSDTVKTGETTLKISQGSTSVSMTAAKEVDFSTADTMVITVDPTLATPKTSVEVASTTAVYTSTGLTDLTTGSTVTVTLIDDPSGQIISDKSITP